MLQGIIQFSVSRVVSIESGHEVIRTASCLPSPFPELQNEPQISGIKFCLKKHAKIVLEWIKTY